MIAQAPRLSADYQVGLVVLVHGGRKQVKKDQRNGRSLNPDHDSGQSLVIDSST